MARRYCYNDVLPLTAMVAIECTNVGLNVLFKKATSKGMSYFIFITYTYAIGALLLLSLSFPFPSRQTHVMEIYPAELLVALFYNICGAIISAPVSLIAESELSSWMLRPSVAVIAVLCSGVIQGFSSFVIAWGLHLKGPVYIAIFKPVSIAIAAFMSAIFLGDSLYLGSIIGAIIISIGFYAVIWGKAKEAERTTSSSKVPLLKVEDARISKRNARILKRK
ncbi:Auxin-induced 5NG4 [Gossypium arboreum]|uniref:Auxin-induced 5NG4 n=1 Tax=Gossypium arboreum TaxID=29729 RepID=A0A0B0N543_GOSAR|nr:Auxin-induced 5NG4 [Gossypium arboreum]